MNLSFIKFSLPLVLCYTLISLCVNTSLAQNINTDATVGVKSGLSISVSNPHEIIPFDEGWRFWLGDDPAAKEPDFKDNGWRTLSLPHDWSIEGTVNPPPEGDNNTGYFYHGIGWYRKNFSSPADTFKKVVIEFDAVYMNSDVSAFATILPNILKGMAQPMF
jgi:hypothetical protein